MKKSFLLLFGVLSLLIIPNEIIAQIEKYQPESDTLVVRTTTVPHYEIKKIQTGTVDTLELRVFDGDNREQPVIFETSDSTFNSIMIAIQNSDDQHEYVVQYLTPLHETTENMAYDSLTAVDTPFVEFHFLILQDSVVVDSIAYTIDQKFGLSTEKEELPGEFSLSQNYPNPFNPSTEIAFELYNSGNVSLIVYDLLGREIDRLIDNQLLPTGLHQRSWQPEEAISSGVYIYQMTVGEQVKTRKMTLIK